VLFFLLLPLLLQISSPLLLMLLLLLLLLASRAADNLMFKSGCHLVNLISPEHHINKDMGRKKKREGEEKRDGFNLRPDIRLIREKNIFPLRSGARYK
jgi:hypothetical protein